MARSRGEQGSFVFPSPASRPFDSCSMSSDRRSIACQLPIPGAMEFTTPSSNRRPIMLTHKHSSGGWVCSTASLLQAAGGSDGSATPVGSNYDKLLSVRDNVIRCKGPAPPSPENKSKNSVNPNLNPKTFSQDYECEFNYVNTNQQEFDNNLYNNSIAPLLNYTMKGDCTLAVFGGASQIDLASYFLSSSTSKGIINRAATALLKSLKESSSYNEDRQSGKAGSVTFSWYTIDCSNGDAISDVLRLASNPSNSSSSSSSSSSMNTSMRESGSNATAELILRELGRGRGMTIPGLWEVEISNGDDIEAIVSYILKSIPDINHANGNLHSVMQLAISRKPFHNNEQTQTPLASSSISDSNDIGRISFLFLSSLTQPAKKKLPKKPDTITSSTNVAHQYAWVELLENVLDYLSSKRAGASFHKSRILLLLRDVLMARQYGTYNLLLSHNSEDALSNNSRWINLSNSILIKNLTKPHTITVSGVADSIVDVSHHAMATMHYDKKISTSVKSSDRNSNNTYVGSPNQPAMSPYRPKSIQVINKNSVFQHPTEIALATALEISQEEVQQTKDALAATTEKFHLCQQAYDTLVGQLKEEGSLLHRKEQERLRNALRDLKDYEIYKDVMENTLIKLQKEIEELSKENIDLQSSLKEQGINYRKQTKNTIKHSKENYYNKTKVDNLEKELDDSIKFSKKLLKDKERSDGRCQKAINAESLLIMENEKKDKEIARLSNMVTELQGSNRKFEAHNAQLAASFNKEITELRTAHSKALELLLEYQEENDKWREMMANGGVGSKSSRMSPGGGVMSPKGSIAVSPVKRSNTK